MPLLMIPSKLPSISPGLLSPANRRKSCACLTSTERFRRSLAYKCEVVLAKKILDRNYLQRFCLAVERIYA